MTFQTLQNFYPDFVPNQILTNTQLNQLRIFLDEQDRISRVRLSGMGIICGLTWSITNNEGEISLSIEEGFGLSSEGYLIQIENIRFDRYRTYIDPEIDEDELPVYEQWKDAAGNQIDIIELIPTDAEEGTDYIRDDDRTIASLTTAELTNRVLILYLEKSDKQLKSCLVTDCNNKGVNVYLNVRAILVNEADLTALSDCTNETTPIYIPRFHSSMRKEGVNWEDLTNQSEINRIYGQIILDSIHNVYLKIEQAYDNYALYLNVPEDKEPFLTKLTTDLPTGLAAEDFTQYHYDYLNDLAQAYNEFIACVCPLIKNCCDANDFPRHLMLGSLSGTEGYRNNFQPSPIRNVLNQDIQKAAKRLQRILYMISGFSVRHLSAATTPHIDITPSHTELTPLGDRTIPYYYSPTANLHKYWQPQDCCTIKPLLHYHLSAKGVWGPNHGRFQEYPTNYFYRQYPFLRIEGHYDKILSTVQTTLNQLQRKHNVEFCLLPLYLGSENVGGSQALSIQASIQNDLDSLEAFYKNYHLRMRELKDITEWSGESILNDDGTIVENLTEDFWVNANNAKDTIFQMNNQWATLKNIQPIYCNINHLQADYLLVRNEMVAFLNRLRNYASELLTKWDEWSNFWMLNNTSSLDDLEARIDQLEQDIETLNDQLDAADDSSTIEDLQAQITAAKKERDFLIAIRTIYTTIRGLRNILRDLKSSYATNERAIADDSSGLETEARVIVGIKLELELLKATLGDLIYYLLPSDLTTFNYPLFKRQYNLILETAQELRLLLALGMYAALAGQREDEDIEYDDDEYLLRANQSTNIIKWANRALESASSEVENPTTVIQIGWLDTLRDLITTVNQYEQHKLNAKLQTLYYSLAYIQQNDLSLFSNFMQKHPGAEHLAGVEKGGTFILVCESNVTGSGIDTKVVADFALAGQYKCCCEIDLSNICFPPVAGVDPILIIRPQLDEDTYMEACAEIPLLALLRNDYAWSGNHGATYDPDFESSLNIDLLSSTSEQGADIIIENGKVIYTNNDTEFFGFDSFQYKIEDQNCNDEVTLGKVIILIVPTLYAATEGKIHGTITDATTGEPVPEAIVTISGEQVFYVTTDANGYFEEDVPAGDYTIAVDAEDYEAYDDPSDIVEVYVNDETQKDIALTREKAAITGVAFDYATGIELETVNVELLEQTTGTLVATTSTDSTGYYLFSGIPFGNYTISAKKTGYGEANISLNVPPNTTTNQDLYLSPLDGQILGTVDASGDLLLGANVILQSPAGATVQATTTDAGGNYSLDNVPAGTYILRVSYIGFNDFVGTIFLSPGQSLTQNVSLSSSLPTVSGNVRSNTTFLPIAGASLIFEDLNDSTLVYNTLTNSGGNYSLSLPDSDYNVIVSASGYETNVQPLSVLSNTNANFLLDPQDGGTVSVEGTIVSDPSGNPLSGANIILSDPTTGGSIINTSSTASGDFSFVAPPGSYQFNVSAPLHEPYQESVNLILGQDIEDVTINLQYNDFSGTFGGGGGTFGSGGAFVFPRNEENENPTPPEPELLTIQGKASFKDVKRKAANVTITFLSNGEKPTVAAQTTTDVSGEYEVQLPAGQYTVNAQTPWYRQYQATIDLNQSPTTHDISLSRGRGNISGQIFQIIDGKEVPLAKARVYLRGTRSVRITNENGQFDFLDIASREASLRIIANKVQKDIKVEVNDKQTATPKIIIKINN